MRFESFNPCSFVYMACNIFTGMCMKELYNLNSSISTLLWENKTMTFLFARVWLSKSQHHFTYLLLVNNCQSVLLIKLPGVINHNSCIYIKYIHLLNKKTTSQHFLVMYAKLAQRLRKPYFSIYCRWRMPSPF